MWVCPFTLYKDGDIVLICFRELIVGDSDELDAFDNEAGLFQRLTLSARKDVFTAIQMPSREGPLSCANRDCYEWFNKAEAEAAVSTFSRQNGCEYLSLPGPKVPTLRPAKTRPSSSLIMAITATRGCNPLQAILPTRSRKGLGEQLPHIIVAEFFSVTLGEKFRREKGLAG